MSDTVRIVEMGARDGLQNEKTPVSVADRIDFIKALVGAGLNTVEVGAGGVGTASYKASEYNGLQNQGGFLPGTVDVRGGR